MKRTLFTLTLICTAIGVMGQTKPKEPVKSNYYYLIGYFAVRQSSVGSVTVGMQKPPTLKNIQNYLHSINVDTVKLIVLGISPLTEKQFKNYFK